MCDVSESHPRTRLVKVVWHGSKKDVRNWVSACVSCQWAKVKRNIKAPLETSMVPERCYDHVNINQVGPLFPSPGFTHLLTNVDRTTRWPEAVSLASTTMAVSVRSDSACPRRFNSRQHKALESIF